MTPDQNLWLGFALLLVAGTWAFAMGMSRPSLIDRLVRIDHGQHAGKSGWVRSRDGTLLNIELNDGNWATVEAGDVTPLFGEAGR